MVVVQFDVFLTEAQKRNARDRGGHPGVFPPVPGLRWCKRKNRIVEKDQIVREI